MRWLTILLISGVIHAQEAEPLVPVATDIVQTLISKRVEPRYPADVLKSGVAGDVVVSVEIDKKGRLRLFTFVSGPGEPRELIANVLFDWRFKPYRVSGTAVPIKSELTLHFPGQQAATGSATVTPTVARASIPDGMPIVSPDDAREMRRLFPRPEYPQAAKQLRVQGSVFLNVLVGPTGEVERIQVLSGPKELIQSSADAVSKWTFKPLVRNGQVTRFITRVEMNFAIQ